MQKFWNVCRGFVICVLLFFNAPLQARESLKVMTHSAFNLPDTLLQSFEKQENVKLVLLKGGDAGEMLAKLILTQKKPIADVVFGIDNALLARAKDHNILAKKNNPHLQKNTLSVFADGNLAPLTPINYGVVSLNYDTTFFASRSLPDSLQTLAEKEFAPYVVLPSPLTSSTGLIFLHAVESYFVSKEAAQKWWQKLRKNGAKVVTSWNQAYYQHFSINGGRYPIILSYITSPAAEHFFNKQSKTSSANLLLKGSYALQVETAAILAGSKKIELAQKFINFLRSPPVQMALQTEWWMLPIDKTIPLNPALTFNPQEASALHDAPLIVPTAAEQKKSLALHHAYIR